MRRVVGKRVVDLSADDVGDLRAAHPGGVLLDVGAGNGKHALDVARRRPDHVVVALDAARDALTRTATRAASAPAKGGAPNLLCVWGAAERTPPEIRGVTELHVLMPWGSLLRGLLAEDPHVRRELAATCAPGAAFLVTLNLHAWRPPVPEVGEHPEPTPATAPDLLGPRYAASGWHLCAARPPEPGELDALATSWTRRLGATREALDVLVLAGTITP